MHELSIAQALVEQAEEIAAKRQGGRVLAITAAIGDLSGVDREALSFAFAIAAEGTAIESARLIVERVPTSAICRSCGATLDAVADFFACGKCGSSDIEVLAGRELVLKSVEIET